MSSSVLPMTNPAMASVASTSFDESESGVTSHASGTVGSGGALEQVVIGKKETAAVYRIRLLVLIVLVSSAAAMATTVYWHLSSTEHENLVQAFADDSRKLSEAIGGRIEKSLAMMDSMAVLFVSYAQLNNHTWPFVSIPNFAAQAAKFLPLSDAFVVNVLPLVTPENRKAWESYAASNYQWVDEAMELQKDWPYYYGPVIEDTLDNSVVHTDYGNLPYNLSRDVLPLWQNFPVIPNVTWTYNADFLAVSLADAYTESINNRVATVSAPYMLLTPGNDQADAETEAWTEYYSQYVAPGVNPVEPIIDLTYPIVSESLGEVQFADGATSNMPADAVIISSAYWRDFTRNILPEGSNGIRIVVENPCTEAFVYEVRGKESVYIGVGDEHKHEIDDLHKAYKLRDLIVSATNESRYTGVPLSTEYCPMTIRFYPSSTMASQYKTSTPVVFTCAALLIFAFTSLVFCLFDKTVERRQKTVLQTAVHSTAIVSSLFPSAVRDRLYPTTQSQQQTKRKIDVLLPDTVKSKLQGFLNDVDNDIEDGKTTTPSGRFHGSPIAELYPETTVLFADIAGFTEWSSTRQPTEVFTLLETLYAEFDDLAKQHGVFKVETIGDCYVAVVGLPVPRKSHAVVMARFASDCMARMHGLTLSLETTLGQGTADLAIRIGLNSGPTTAGVLRGEKSRFQLFGDTVNTAARMESNGERDKIHVSEKTAELIKLAGKAHWLTKRDEQVHCKGKGTMITYWCEPRSESIGNRPIIATGEQDLALGPTPNPLVPISESFEI